MLRNQVSTTYYIPKITKLTTSLVCIHKERIVSTIVVTPYTSCCYLIVCPVKVVTLVMLGYRHTIIWFREYPCVLTISLIFFDHIRLQTFSAFGV